MFDTVANTLAFDVLGLDPASHTGAAVQFFIMDVAKIFALLVVVIYVMGLLRALVAPERVREFVRGRPDWQARGLAVSLGAVTPFTEVCLVVFTRGIFIFFLDRTADRTPVLVAGEGIAFSACTTGCRVRFGHNCLATGNTDWTRDIRQDTTTRNNGQQNNNSDHFDEP